MKNLYISIILIGLCFWLIGCFTLAKNDLNDYNKKIEDLKISQQVMPNLDDLPNYEKIYYQYRHKTIVPLIFITETMLLVVTYDEETYQIEKSKINNLDYLTRIVYETHENEIWYLLPEYEFQINSFNFRVLEANQTNGFRYPHHIGIIATSDEKKSIAYLYFCDYDLDYISIDKTKGEMSKFIKKYFKYRW